MQWRVITDFRQLATHMPPPPTTVLCQFARACRDARTASHAYGMQHCGHGEVHCTPSPPPPQAARLPPPTCAAGLADSPSYHPSCAPNAATPQDPCLPRSHSPLTPCLAPSPCRCFLGPMPHPFPQRGPSPRPLQQQPWRLRPALETGPPPGPGGLHPGRRSGARSRGAAAAALPSAARQGHGRAPGGMRGAHRALGGGC